MYRKPGFRELSASVSHIQWARSLYASEQVNTFLWEANITEFFRSINKNLNRKFRFLQPEDIYGATTPAAPIGSAMQRAFVHLMSRWMHHLKLQAFSTYPVLVTYNRLPFISFDECVDAMLDKEILYPSWEDIGHQDARLEEVVPIFVDFIRDLISLEYLRKKRAIQLRFSLAHIGYKLASSQPIDQFERSFFVSYSDPQLPLAVSTYSAVNKPMRIGENTDPSVTETFGLLKASVDPGPITNFALLNSNKVLQELFAFLGPYTPTLEFSYGMIQKSGLFGWYRTDEKETIPWSLEEQEDAYRMSWAQVVPDVSSVLTVAQPTIITGSPRRDLTPAEATYRLSLDTPDVNIRMCDGYNSYVSQWEGDWWSRTRGRQVSNAHGANESVLLQDMALEAERLGQGQVGVTSLVPTWSLFDFEHLENDVQMRSKFVAKQSLTETISTINTATGEVVETPVNMAPFYTLRGQTMLRPAFSEYVMVHRGTLRVVDSTAENYIQLALNLSRTQRRRSELAIRMSHRWHVIKRLFDVEVVSKQELNSLIKLEAGALPQD